jgi:hypothetical protein
VHPPDHAADHARYGTAAGCLPGWPWPLTGKVAERARSDECPLNRGAGKQAERGGAGPWISPGPAQRAGLIGAGLP